jgi:hypothetical protein
MLPVELLHQILWTSRELSLINVCRRFREELPPFLELARRLAVLAFCEPDTDLEQSQRAQHPIPTFLPGPIDPDFLNQFRLPPTAGLPFPLSIEQRAQLQHDVLSSAWWSPDRFHALHCFLYRYYLISLAKHQRAGTMWMPELDVQKYIGHLRHINAYWTECIQTAALGDPNDSRITSRVVFPTMSVLIWERTSTLDCKPEIARCSTSQFGFSWFAYNEGQEASAAWPLFDVNEPERYGPLNAADGGSDHLDYYLPPRSLLKPPFTSRKRGILICLLQELAGRRFITERAHQQNIQEDFRLMHEAILFAIPTGDARLLKYLIYLASQITRKSNTAKQPLDSREPPTILNNGNRIPKDIECVLVDVSFSQNVFLQYYAASVSTRQPHSLKLLLEHIPVFTAQESLNDFQSTMVSIFEQYCGSARTVKSMADNSVLETMLELIDGKIRAMRAVLHSREESDQVNPGSEEASTGGARRTRSSASSASPSSLQDYQRQVREHAMLHRQGRNRVISVKQHADEICLD